VKKEVKEIQKFESCCEHYHSTETTTLLDLPVTIQVNVTWSIDATHTCFTI